MRNVMIKEIRLSAHILSFVFILFGLMFFLPGYPVLCGAFFVTLGIYQSFQNTRETGDILFSALLPIAKKDVVGGKFAFVCLIELCGLGLMGFATVMRMTVLSDAAVYRNNALMNANGFALGVAFLIFGLFNLVFVAGFFKTVYKIGLPFLRHIILTFVVIGIAEALHHIPGLEALNAFGTDRAGLQTALFLLGVMCYALLTLAAYKTACKRFERIDL